MDYKKISEKSIQITECKVLGKLPDPFRFDDGSVVKTAFDWKRRRKEILKTAVELQYGVMPPTPEFLDVLEISNVPSPRCYSIVTGTRKRPVRMMMYLFLPRGNGPFPVVISGDLCFDHVFHQDFVRKFTDNGIMLALFNRTELVPDKLELGRSGQLYETYPCGDFGAIAAWAWGYSRCVDALGQIGLCDPKWITFTGHSRGAKAAMLAGALDTRAAIVNPNASCAGGCGCYRIHMSALSEDGRILSSETLRDIWNHFPFWFGPKLGDYADCEEKLPFDSHELKALVAPRILFDSQACGDIWSNPLGSYQTTRAAEEVYRFLGAQDRLYWYFRSGTHNQSPQDVAMLVNIIRHHRLGEPLSEDFFKFPFRKPEPIFDWEAPKERIESTAGD